ncbi:MAG: DUF1214 domain-containing protein [Bradyrhizobium sp.]
MAFTVADGSLTVYVQSDSPADPVQRANWLPAPNGDFLMYGLIGRDHRSPTARGRRRRCSERTETDIAINLCFWHFSDMAA